jgi:DNA-binding PadR family transcriptional regulator
MGDASGYEIKKRLEEGFTHFYDASFGSIYPALGRLQEEGFVTCSFEPQSKRPDKKVYALTVDGRLELLRELSQDPSPDRIRCEFLVSMLFADLLPVSRVAEMIDKRIERHNEQLAELSERCTDGSPAQRFVAGYGRALYEAAVNYLEEYRYLVESEALMAPSELSKGAMDLPRGADAD